MEKLTFNRGKVIFNLGDNTHKRLELLELLLSQLKIEQFNMGRTGQAVASMKRFGLV